MRLRFPWPWGLGACPVTGGVSSQRVGAFDRFSAAKAAGVGMPGQELPWKPPPPLWPVTGTACRKGALSGWRGRAPRQPRLLPVRTWLQAPGARTAAQGPSACRRPGAPGEGVCHRGDLAQHRTAGVETRDPCPSPRIAAAPRWSGAHRRHRWPQGPWPGGDCWLGRARPGDHGPHAESRPAGGSGGRAVDGTPLTPDRERPLSRSPSRGV